MKGIDGHKADFRIRVNRAMTEVSTLQTLLLRLRNEDDLQSVDDDTLATLTISDRALSNELQCIQSAVIGFRHYAEKEVSDARSEASAD